MRCPTGMPDAAMRRGKLRMVFQLFLQQAESAFRLDDLNSVFLHGNSGGVIPAVLQGRQPVQKDRHSFCRPGVSYDTTHNIQNLSGNGHTEKNKAPFPSAWSVICFAVARIFVTCYDSVLCRRGIRRIFRYSPRLVTAVRPGAYLPAASAASFFSFLFRPFSEYSGTAGFAPAVSSATMKSTAHSA